MFRKTVYLILGTALTCGSAYAQYVPKTPTERDLNCSGVISNQAPPTDTYVISGQESYDKDVFWQGQYVFINKGSSQGVKMGDQYSVSRPENDLLQYPWFKEQPALMKAMGQKYSDIGRLRVVSVAPNTATAEIVSSCDIMYRDDIVQPFTERPAPPYKPTEKTFDVFAAPSGKAKARIVITNDFGQMAGAGADVYINLGSSQGVKVGDYVRVFRYQGENDENSYQTGGTAYKMYGYGQTPVPYGASDLPRDVLGEGIVLRVGPNAATVFLTQAQREIYMGDFVELE
jgi:hypothetical protein